MREKKDKKKASKEKREIKPIFKPLNENGY